jgi:hypothetical protein
MALIQMVVYLVIAAEPDDTDTCKESQAVTASSTPSFPPTTVVDHCCADIVLLI